METTPTTATLTIQPATPDFANPPRKRPVGSVLAGLALGTISFVFGGFVALLALPACLPGARRARPFAYALVGGVALCWVISAAGGNPWAHYVKARILAQVESTLGAPLQYDSYRADPLTGQIEFTNPRAEIPELEGEVSAATLRIEAGYGFLVRLEPALLTARGVKLGVNAGRGRLETFLAKAKPSSTPVSIVLDEVTVDMHGSPMLARFFAERIWGSAAEAGWKLAIRMDRAQVAILEREHRFELEGGLTISRDPEGLLVEANMAFIEEEIVKGIVQGRLRPQTGDGALICTIDQLELGPLWGMYRQVDEYTGFAVGVLTISGTLNDLWVEVNLEIEDYTYYHAFAMGLKPEQKFNMPRGSLSGALQVVNGEFFKLHAITLESEFADLSTNPRLTAKGAGTLSLSGEVGNFKAELAARVHEAVLREEITWSPTTTTGLEDVAPNLLKIAEQFSGLKLVFALEIVKLDVQCAPISGVAAGMLSGTFTKLPGQGPGVLRANGELSMPEGKFKFCDAEGDVALKLTFSDKAPTPYATLTGELKARAGSVDLNARIGGMLSHPLVAFHGVTMAPDKLGEHIYRYQAKPLDTAERTRRDNEVARLCGLQAATSGNPFLAQRTGKVSFTFSP